MAGVEIDGKFFSLNGRRFAFRGVTYGTFAPREDSALFPSRSQIKSDFASIQNSGFDTVRTYTEPPDDLLDLAADWGLHVFAGVHWNDWRYLRGASRRQQREVARDARQIVAGAARRLAGNDTVAAISVGNEIPADVVRWVGTSRVASLVRELADTVREQDPGRLVTYANYPTTEYLPLEALDFLTFNVFLEGANDLKRYLNRLHNLAGDRPLVLGELGAHASAGEYGDCAQASAIRLQLETALERGVGGTCVFSWTDEWSVAGEQVLGWQFGLTRTDRSPRAALRVIEDFNRRSVADLTPAHGWPSVAVVICAYNAESTLEECLRHVSALDYRPLEVIVVDDGSRDDTVDVARGFPHVRLVRIDHAGLGAARNAGYRAARSELIAYLDSDAYPCPEWPYYLALGASEAGLGGVGGPNIPPPADPRGARRVARASGGPIHVLLEDDRAEHVPGCNMAFRRTVLEELGGFDPIFTSAGDDVDFCWKVLDDGYEIAFHPAAFVWHHRRGSTRAYLRQQRGYGRADALVALRHPARINAIGAARWVGRIYRPTTGALRGQRVYHGLYATAPFQSVYSSGTTVLDTAQQIGVPLAAAVLLVTPATPFVPVLLVPVGAAAVTLLALFTISARQILPQGRSAGARARFQISVAMLDMAQTVVRLWGRTFPGTDRVIVPPPPPSLPSAVLLTTRVMAFSDLGSRGELVGAVVAALRYAGFFVQASTGWETCDACVSGSLTVKATISTVSAPAGVVQLRVRRWPRVALGVGLAVAGAALVANAALAIVIVMALALETARGLWRTGPGVRRAIQRAGGMS
ncbi:MAG: glycosyl transferase family 2 [Acidimicrobiaceae bacterium]|nr:glycosyl transferase family 2 [Acidimicrobiaceae bacterium]